MEINQSISQNTLRFLGEKLFYFKLTVIQKSTFYQQCVSIMSIMKPVNIIVFLLPQMTSQAQIR